LKARKLQMGAPILHTLHTHQHHYCHFATSLLLVQ